MIVGADGEEVYHPAFRAHDHNLLMVVELIDIEVLTECLQKPDIVAMRKRVAESEVNHIGLAPEEILEEELYGLVLAEEQIGFGRKSLPFPVLAHPKHGSVAARML